MNIEKEERFSYHEKKSIATLISNTLIFGSYCWYIYSTQLNGNPAAFESQSFWAKAILILIPVSIVSRIIISIVGAIVYRITTGENVPSIMDERDKLIELRSIRNAHYTFVLGFLLGMITIVLKMPVYMFFVCVIGVGFLSEVVAVATQLYLYRKGI
jgi:hypothetical protein